MYVSGGELPCMFKSPSSVPNTEERVYGHGKSLQ